MKKTSIIPIGYNPESKNYGFPTLQKGYGKGDPEPDVKDPVELKKALQEIVDKFSAKQKELSEAIDKKAGSDALANIEKEIKELNEARWKTMDEVMLKQGEKLTELENERKEKSKRVENLKNLLENNFLKHKDSLTAIRKEGRAKAFSMELNLKDIIVGPSNFDNITVDSIVMPGIGQVPYRMPFLESIVNHNTQKGDGVRYVDQHDIVRGATVIDGCAAYPVTSDIQWEERFVAWSKIGDSIAICQDAIDDHDYVMGEIMNLLRVNVNLKVDALLLTGSGVAPNPLGFQTIADEFVAAAPFATAVITPTVWDLINAVAAQLSAASFGWFTPNYVLMNPLDVALMGMDKTAAGIYQTPPFVDANGARVAGMIVIANTGITQNTLLVGDFTKATLYDAKALTIAFADQHASDFLSDIIRVKVTRRLANVIRNVDANAFVKVSDIAAALAAITAP